MPGANGWLPGSYAGTQGGVEVNLRSNCGRLSFYAVSSKYSCLEAETRIQKRRNTQTECSAPHTPDGASLPPGSFPFKTDRLGRGSQAIGSAASAGAASCACS